MRIDLLLVTKGLFKTRQEAQEAIIKSAVLVNGQAVIKPSKSIPENSSIEVLWTRKYVSRGGEKLEGVFLDVFKTEEAIKSFLDKKVALDVGSSTGGFTDFLLQNGIQEVTCVDVGSLQLHEKIASDKRVKLFENTDIRDFPKNNSYDVIVGDVSFISLEKILDVILSFGVSGTYFFLLIKPQFEVGKGNTKKGLVKNAELVKEIINTYKQLATDKSCKDILVTPCRVVGGDGNQEYFLTFRRP